MSNTPESKEDEKPFWDVIDTYSRAQAIEDGMLIDLTQFSVCHQHYKYPVACTSAVWDIIERGVNADCGNDYEGVLHDIFSMSKMLPYKRTETSSFFKVIITGAGKKKYHNFKIVCGPGDNAEPVMTLMLPDED